MFQSQGEDGECMLPILRSADLVTWQYAGEVFTPAWHNGSRLWAPDIRYVDGRYHVYYAVPGRDTVGLATAPTPTGPWTDEGAVLPTPSGCPTGDIDQALLPASNGTLKLTRRPMLIDRLDWINGWPVLRAGAGPSDTAQPAPATTTTTTFATETSRRGWTFPSETDSGT